jgi:hypothetical protein
MKAHEPFVPWPQLQAELQSFEADARSGDVASIKAFLSQHVQGYQTGPTATL